MNTQNEVPTNLPPETKKRPRRKEEKPGMFGIVSCFIVGVICIVLQLMSYVGNGKIFYFQEINSISQLFYDLLLNLSYNLMMIIGITAVIIGMKDLKKRKEWKDK